MKWESWDQTPDCTQTSQKAAFKPTEVEITRCKVNYPSVFPPGNGKLRKEVEQSTPGKLGWVILVGLFQLRIFQDSIL